MNYYRRVYFIVSDDTASASLFISISVIFRRRGLIIRAYGSLYFAATGLVFPLLFRYRYFPPLLCHRLAVSSNYGAGALPFSMSCRAIAFRPLMTRQYSPQPFHSRTMLL